MKLFEVVQPLFENKVSHIAKQQGKKIVFTAVRFGIVEAFEAIRGEEVKLMGNDANEFVSFLSYFHLRRNFTDDPYGMIGQFSVNIADYLNVFFIREADDEEEAKQYLMATLEEVATDIVQFMADNISKKHLQWVVNRFIRGDFDLEEDYQIIKRSLEIYEQMKSEIGVQLNNKVSTADLFELVEPYRETVDAETAKAKEKELLARGEIEIPFSQGPKELVIIPKTFEASHYLSEPNGWCTQYENWFAKYTKDDQTLYYFRHEGKPHLVHFESNQFMKKGNKRFDTDEIRESSPAFQWILNNKYEEFKSKLPEADGKILSTLFSLGMISNKEAIDIILSEGFEGVDRLTILNRVVDDEHYEYFINKAYSAVSDEVSFGTTIIYHHRLFNENYPELNMDILLNTIDQQKIGIGNLVDDFRHKLSLLIRQILNSVGADDLMQDKVARLIRISMKITQNSEETERTVYQIANPKYISDEVYDRVLNDILPSFDEIQLKSNYVNYRLIGYMYGKENFDFIYEQMLSGGHWATPHTMTLQIIHSDSSIINSIIDEFKDRGLSSFDELDTLLRLVVMVNENMRSERVNIEPLIDDHYEVKGEFTPFQVTKLIRFLKHNDEINDEKAFYRRFFEKYGITDRTEVLSILDDMAGSGSGGAIHYALGMYDNDEISYTRLLKLLGLNEFTSRFNISSEEELYTKLTEIVDEALHEKTMIHDLRNIIETKGIDNDFKMDILDKAVENMGAINSIEHLILDVFYDVPDNRDTMEWARHLAEQIGMEDEYFGQSLATVLYDTGYVDLEWMQEYYPEMYQESYAEDEEEY